MHKHTLMYYIAYSKCVVLHIYSQHIHFPVVAVQRQCPDLRTDYDYAVDRLRRDRRPQKKPNDTFYIIY